MPVGTAVPIAPVPATPVSIKIDLKLRVPNAPVALTPVTSWE